MFVVYPTWITHAGDKGLRAPIYSIHVQPIRDGRIATGGQDGKVKVWALRPVVDPDVEADPGASRLLSTLSLHSGAVLCVRWSNIDGRLLASGSDDHKLVIWELDRSAPPVQSSFLIAGGGGKDLEVWRPIKVLFGHESDVADLAWSPQNEYLASAGFDGFVFIWDGTTFERLRKLDNHEGFVKGVTWDPVGKFLATQSDDKSVRIWRVSDWVVERLISGPYETAASTTFFRRLSWSPEGSTIISANGENGNIPVAPIISRDDWTTQLSLVGHQAPVEVALFNPVMFRQDGGANATNVVVCAVGSQDKGVSVWWTNKPYCAASACDLFKHSVLDLAWSHDGYTLLACSYDGTVAALTFDPAELGSPVPPDEGHAIMAKYGYKKNKVAVAESVEQLLIEESDIPLLTTVTQQQQQQDRVVPTPQHVPTQSVPPASLQQPRPAAAAETKDAATPQKFVQTETRTADGRKRIQPTFVRSFNGTSESTAISHSNTSTMIQTSVATPINPLKRKQDDAMDSNGGKRVEYVLPTCITAKEPIILAVPAVKNRWSIQIPGGPGMGTDENISLECKNPEKSSESSRITGSIGADMIFVLSLKAPVLSMCGGSEFFAASCLDGSLHVFSFSGRRKFPCLVLPSVVSKLSGCRTYLMCITSLGGLYLWDVKTESCLIQNEPVTPVLSRDFARTSTTSLSLTAASVKHDGTVLISTSNGGLFTYHTSLKVWVNVTGYDLPGEVTNVRTPSGIVVPKVPIFGKLPATEFFAVTEDGLASSLVMRSPDNYIKWLQNYAVKISDEGAVSKARELCESFITPTPNATDGAAASALDILGHKKEDLLRLVLGIFGKNRDLQRITRSYMHIFEV